MAQARETSSWNRNPEHCYSVVAAKHASESGECASSNICCQEGGTGFVWGVTRSQTLSRGAFSRETSQQPIVQKRGRGSPHWMVERGVT